MTAGRERWQRLSRLFDAAIELDGEARTAFVVAECDGDDALRADLQRLLDADAAASNFDDGAASAVSLDDPEAPDDASGEHLGAWRLHSRIGSGGMGTVYAARREDGDTAQRAAIKRLQRRWDGSAQAQRFLQERRILAQLSHANIPALLDHGLDEDGRPWFALEYVDGEPLTAWADTQRLNPRERLVLFLQVCAAVQHAHERFVVHRDLKPANILVDEGGRARVLDFGVAKRIDDVASTTRTGAFAGFTPEYAAPEQISGGPVSAATDVYALGVLLYELLSGQLPYHFTQADLRETAEAITSRSAERLERALTTGTPEEVQARIERRRTSAPAFRRYVRGDLTRIVQTALAKEPERRYSSVLALADDLKRFLDGRPVSVVGDTFGYRARKFVQRNRWSVAMGALALAALLGGGTFSAYRAHQERIQRERSEAVLAFVSDLFASGAKGDPHANQLSVPELLGRASGRIDNAFPDDPLGRAQLFGVVGGAYAEMGQGAPAIDYTRKALAILRPLREELPVLYLENVRLLGDGLTIDSRYADVVSLVDAELPFARRRGSPTDDVARLLRQRGWARNQLGDAAGAEADLHAAIALHERARTPPSRNLASIYSDLGQVLGDTGQSREALLLLQKAGNIQARAADSPHVDRLLNQQNIAREHFRLGETSRAIALLETEIPQLERAAGADFPQAITARNALSQAYAAQGRYAAALGMVERNLQIQTQRPNADEEQLWLTRLVKAKLLTYAGRADEALPLAEAGVAFLRRKYPQPTTLRGRVQWVLGETLLRQRRCDQAAAHLRAALDDERAMTGGKPSAPAGEALDSLGRCQMMGGDFAAAEPLLEQAVAAFIAAQGADDARTLRSQLHLAWLRHAHKPSTATLAQLQQAIARLEHSADPANTALREQLKALLQPAASTDAARGFLGLNSFS